VCTTCKATGRDARAFDPVIRGIYPAHNEDRLLVRLEEVRNQLVQALIAIEDRKFYNTTAFICAA